MWGKDFLQIARERRERLGMDPDRKYGLHYHIPTETYRGDMMFNDFIVAYDELGQVKAKFHGARLYEEEVAEELGLSYIAEIRGKSRKWRGYNPKTKRFRVITAKQMREEVATNRKELGK